jgi:hypothetical protein
VRKAAVLLDLVLQCNALQASDGAINPIDDLAELRATIDFVRSSLTPRLQAGYDVAATDLAAEICMREVLATLDTLTQFVTAFLLSKLRAPLPHGQRALTVEMWRDKRIYLYQLDFLLKLQVDQFSNLFLAGVDAASLIEDSEGQQLWISCFGGRHVRRFLFFSFFFWIFFSSLSPFDSELTRACRSRWCRGMCFGSC